jgi:hypothetical protein
VSDVAKTADPLDVIDTQIAEAYSELLMARADCTRSPNADSVRTEEYAELRLNRLLERRHVARQGSKA